MNLGRVLLLTLALPITAQACPGLEVHAAWVREPPPGSPGTAAFMQLHNAGTSPLTLTQWHSPQFGMTMLHATEVIDGEARMRAPAPLSLPPGTDVTLAPGGLHLMLMKPVQSLHEGDLVSIEINCGPHAQTFALPVRRAPPAAP